MGGGGEHFVFESLVKSLHCAKSRGISARSPISRSRSEAVADKMAFSSKLRDGTFAFHFGSLITDGVSVKKDPMISSGRHVASSALSSSVLASAVNGSCKAKRRSRPRM